MNIEDLFNEMSELVGEDLMSNALENMDKDPLTVEQRIELLEKYALTVINVPGFDPEKDFVRFRKIRLLKQNRVHSLLVDVIRDQRRYTAALQKRISTGERDPNKWIQDVNEAVAIALSKPPVALCAVENRVSDFSRSIVEVFYDDDHDLKKGVVFVWGGAIADCRGPLSNIIEILEKIHTGDASGLTIKSSTEEVSSSNVAEDQREEDGRGEDVVYYNTSGLSEDTQACRS